MLKLTETIYFREFSCLISLPKLPVKLETMSKEEVLELIVDDIVALNRIPLALKEDSEFKLTSYIQKENKTFICSSKLCK